MDIDEALESPENYSKYIRSLSDVGANDVYMIAIESDQEIVERYLLLADTDSEAIAEFDLSFLEVHRDGIKGNPVAMRLYSPDEVGEGRQLLAEISL